MAVAVSRVSPTAAPVPSSLSTQPSTPRPPRFQLQFSAGALTTVSTSMFSLCFVSSFNFNVEPHLCNSFQFPTNLRFLCQTLRNNLAQHQLKRISNSATNSIQVVLVSQSAQQLPSSNQFDNPTVDQQSVSHQQRQLSRLHLHSATCTPYV